MKREACRTCGAITLEDAATLCQQVQGISGDYYCPGDSPGEDDVDVEGYFLYPTEEGNAMIAAAIDQMDDDARLRGDI